MSNLLNDQPSCPSPRTFRYTCGDVVDGPDGGKTATFDPVIDGYRTGYYGWFSTTDPVLITLLEHGAAVSVTITAPEVNTNNE
jgi:hypothetical protein